MWTKFLFLIFCKKVYGLFYGVGTSFTRKVVFIFYLKAINECNIKTCFFFNLSQGCFTFGFSVFHMPFRKDPKSTMFANKQVFYVVVLLTIYNSTTRFFIQ